jgi:hypothetical protein
VAGSTASDAYYKAMINGGQAWTWGLDNSDSDAFVISASATPGTTNVMRASTAGEVNFPLQPSFNVVPSSVINNVTGDSTLYQVPFNTVRYDQNSGYNMGLNAFFATVNGKYLFGTAVRMTGILSTHTTGFVQINTPNKVYVYEFNPATTAANGGSLSFLASVITDMDLGDPCIINLVVQNGTKVVNLYNDGTVFYGNLLA